MCLGIPMRIESIEGWTGLCRAGDDLRAIDLSLLPDARPGDHVLTFLGAGRRRLDAEEARQIGEALAALDAAMRDDADAIEAAFADLVGREPTLPPHLAAQLASDREDPAA